MLQQKARPLALGWAKRNKWVDFVKFRFDFVKFTSGMPRGNRGKSPEAEAEGEREGEDVGLVCPAHAAAGREGTAARCVALAHEDPLLALTLLGVFVGLIFGLLLTAVLPGAEDTTGTRKTIVKLVSFPGKMFLNLLKMMVVPLISGSMIAGVCALQSAGANTGKLARVTFSFFAATTLIAVFIGLVVVNVIQPGL